MLIPLIVALASPLTARTPDAAAIDHVLSRVTFGPTAAERQHVAESGIRAYIDEQLDPASIDDSALDQRLASLQTLRTATPPLMARFNPPRVNSFPVVLPMSTTRQVLVNNPGSPQPVIAELQRAAFLRAVYSRRQLYERMVDFWENHFNVYIYKDYDRLYLTSFDRDAIRPFALGNFRQLLGAVAKSPAMLYYLDNWQSAGTAGGPGRPVRHTGLNENYARELLELHTMGVDGGYTQRDVVEVARCFTGWTIYRVNDTGLFLFDPSRHDNGEKWVLGHRIPPGGGIADGEMVLDLLARHPSTARFIATKLARMFVSDNPPAAVVRRAAAVFLNTDGSIAETVRSILTSREFRSRRSYGAKLKSPFEYAVSAVRELGAETDGGPAMLAWIARMGEPLFGRLTPDGYPDRSSAWLSTGTLLERMNFAVALAGNRIAGTHYDGKKSAKPETAVSLQIGSPGFQVR